MRGAVMSGGGVRVVTTSGGGVRGVATTSGGGVGGCDAASSTDGAGADDRTSGGGVSGPESSARTAAASAARAAASASMSTRAGAPPANGSSSPGTGGGGGRTGIATGIASTGFEGIAPTTPISVVSGAGVGCSSNSAESSAVAALTGSSSDDAGALPPTTGTPRGCVVVRLRTSGVEKSPELMPIGPLRSRGPAERTRRGVAPSATTFLASPPTAFAAPRVGSFDAREGSSWAFDTGLQPRGFPVVAATRPMPTPIFTDAPAARASSSTRPGSNTTMVVEPR